MHGNAAGMAIGQRRAPLGFFGSQVESREHAGFVLEQLAVVLERVLAGGIGQFVDDRLHDKTGMAVPHRAPPQHRYAGAR
ncbi:hypothetical protein D3C72_2324900 [compost metagenome]